MAMPRRCACDAGRARKLGTLTLPSDCATTASLSALARQLADLAVAEETGLEPDAAVAALAVQQDDVLAGLQVLAAAEMELVVGQAARDERAADRQQILGPDVEASSGRLRS